MHRVDLRMMLMGFCCAVLQVGLQRHSHRASLSEVVSMNSVRRTTWMMRYVLAAVLCTLLALCVGNIPCHSSWKT